MPDLTLHLAEALKTQAMPVFERVNTLDDYAAYARSRPSGGQKQSIAYTLALAGRYSEAVVVLDEVMSNLDLKLKSQQDLRDQATELKAKILRNPDEARQQLLEWEEESVRNLKLENIELRSNRDRKEMSGYAPVLALRTRFSADAANRVRRACCKWLMDHPIRIMGEFFPGFTLWAGLNFPFR